MAFGYFDDQDKLRYYNCYKGADGNTYDPENFNVKMINADVSKIDRFCLVVEQGGMIIHPVSENLNMF